MGRFRVILFTLVTASTGCAVGQLHHDQDGIRSTLLDLYTDQIMDNLVRASNGLPFIQLDYTQAQGLVTVKSTASLGDNQAATLDKVFSIPAKTVMLTRTIVTTLSGNLGAENTNQVSVVATPVTTSNEVYDAYLAFLSLPGSLMVSCDPPPPGQAHICQKSGKNYYWVPVVYKSAFLRLALLTTAQRGKAMSPPDEFFTVTLTEALPGKPYPPFPKKVSLVTVKLDKKIPNDTGYIKVGTANEQYDVHRYETEDNAVPSETERIVLTIDNDKLKAFKAKLPMSAKVYLQHRQPKPPTTDDLLNRVNFQLQQIQFNQLRQPNL